MDSYNVIISPKALAQLESYIDYIQYTLFNDQAAKAVWDDAVETVSQLGYMANMISLCENNELAQLGYRKILFQKHDYVMLYRIEGEKVFVDGIYHQMQDYENVFSSNIVK